VHLRPPRVTKVYDHSRLYLQFYRIAIPRPAARAPEKVNRDESSLAGKERLGMRSDPAEEFSFPSQPERFVFRKR
jgi:hypothetical protein